VAPQRFTPSVSLTFRALVGALLLSSLAGCPNQEYSECDDSGCYYCDGLGCRDAAPPERASCDCAHPCGASSTCTDLGCTLECETEADCLSGTTCREGLCLGFVSRGVRETSTAVSCACPCTDPGLICRDATCVPGCETSDDCQAENPGYVCLDGTCTPTITPECDATTPCRSPLECVAGECRAPSDTCQFSSECGAGRVCVNQQCTTACGLDNPCPTGAMCTDGFCVVTPPPVDECVVNADCGEGEICRDGSCYDECALDADCGAGRYCQEGRCRLDTRPRPTCSDSRPCASGSVCLNGTCRIPCTTAPQCAAFDVQYNFCLDMLCATSNEATSDCAAQADCNADQSCIDGICR
jgi:hypothetical protein